MAFDTAAARRCGAQHCRVCAAVSHASGGALPPWNVLFLQLFSDILMSENSCRCCWVFVISQRGSMRGRVCLLGLDLRVAAEALYDMAHGHWHVVPLGLYVPLSHRHRVLGSLLQAANLKELYKGTRHDGLGPEVKRRILMGTYALSAGFYDAYYKRAQQVLHTLPGATQTYADRYSYRKSSLHSRQRQQRTPLSH